KLCSTSICRAKRNALARLSRWQRQAFILSLPVTSIVGSRVPRHQEKSAAATFDYDFHVALDPGKSSVDYNYADAEALHRAGKLWSTKGELPGLSVFRRDGDDVFHMASTERARAAGVY